MSLELKRAKHEFRTQESKTWVWNSREIERNLELFFVKILKTNYHSSFSLYFLWCSFTFNTQRTFVILKFCKSNDTQKKKMLNLVKGLRKYKKMSTISTRLMIWAVHPKTLGEKIRRNWSCIIVHFVIENWFCSILLHGKQSKKFPFKYLKTILIESIFIS
jgi:hypothetical protein